MQLDYENVISVYTFSKTYAMTGWRLGYAVSRNAKLINLLKLGDYTQTAGIPTYTQFAGAEALTNSEKENEAIENFMKEYIVRRDTLYEGLKNIPDIKLPSKPEGAFYIFPDFSEFVPNNINNEDRKTFIFNKLIDAGVATVYGSCFGKFFENNLRFSYSTTSVAQIEDGLNKIESALKK